MPLRWCTNVCMSGARCVPRPREDVDEEEGEEDGDDGKHASKKRKKGGSTKINITLQLYTPAELLGVLHPA